MKRIIMTGGNISGGVSLRHKLILTGFIILGVVLMIFFAFAVMALAVVLIPVGIALFVVRKLLLHGRKVETSEVEPLNTREIKDIIDITEYENTEDLKMLQGHGKDGK